MSDIYDEAIQATLKHDHIRSSWVAGGDDPDTPLHGLLFRSCPHLCCCLTEYRNGMGAIPHSSEELLVTLRDDDLIPRTQHDLESEWDNADTEARTALLELFAMYNRELDELFDREPADIA